MAEAHFRRPDRTRECSLLRCWSELAPFLHDQDDQRDTAVGRCRQRACEGRRSSQICSSSSGGAALADRGAAEELVDGIDPNARSSIAIPSRHHDWTAYGAACDVRSANAHADCTSVCRCASLCGCVLLQCYLVRRTASERRKLSGFVLVYVRTVINRLVLGAPARPADREGLYMRLALWVPKDLYATS